MPNSTRRQFMKKSGTTVAAAMVAASQLPTTRAAQEKRVRVGVIGSTGKGDYGHGVDVAFLKLPNVEIVALADEDLQGREAASQRTHPKKTYADYREMLAEETLDLVAICPRWIDQHHGMVTAAAKANCHVYMEKPFCRTLLECDRAVEELETRRLKLAIAHVSQYSPVLAVVRKLIENDEIGEVLELRGRGKEDRRGGGEDLWVLGSHVFGLMRTLAGGDATSCSAVVLERGQKITSDNVVAGAEGIGPLAGDHVQATYTFPSGAAGFFASRRGMGGDPSRFGIQVFGSKGVIEMQTGFGVRAHILRDSSWSPSRTGKSWEPISSNGIGKAETRADGTYEGGHVAAIQDLLDSVAQDRNPQCSARDARAIVEMIAAVFESQRVGAPVELPLATRVNPLTLLS